MAREPIPAGERAPVVDTPPHCDLVIVHLVVALHSGPKGWRTTVRIQDGWQGAVLTHWSRGGSDCVTGATKALADLDSAVSEALGHLAPF
jgi:hypothetical protein